MFFSVLMWLSVWLSALSGCVTVSAPERLLEVPEFSLMDQDGQPVGRADLAGEVWLAAFIFTSCPGPCPMISAHMREIQDHYRDVPAAADLRLLSFTVDPATDQPGVLRAYGERFGADFGRWRLLTGEPVAVEALIVGGFKQALQRLPPPEGAPAGQPVNILHAERLMLVDRAGWMRGLPDPYEPDKRRLYAMVDAVLAEGR